MMAVQARAGIERTPADKLSKYRQPRVVVEMKVKFQRISSFSVSALGLLCILSTLAFLHHDDLRHDWGIVMQAPQVKAWNPMFERLEEPLGTGEQCKWTKYASMDTGIRGVVDSKSLKMVYPKVPKSGSTTVSCMLERFLAKRNMTTLMPMRGLYHIVGDEDGIAGSMREQHISSFDALLSHMRYNESLVNEHLSNMKEDGTVVPPFRLSSIRNPEDRLASAYYHGRFRLENNISELAFCSDMTRDYRRWVDSCVIEGQVSYMTPKDWLEPDNTSVPTIFNHFDHVFVTDRMSESILALAPKLGLDLEDMLVVTMKVEERRPAEKILTDEERGDLSKRIQDKVLKQKDDWEFYKLANENLDAELAQLPVAYKGIAEDLDEMTREVSLFCRDSGQAPLFAQCIRRYLRSRVNCKDLNPIYKHQR